MRPLLDPFLPVASGFFLSCCCILFSLSLSLSAGLSYLPGAGRLALSLFMRTEEVFRVHTV